MRARLDRRDVLLEHQLLLEFERLPIASPEMLLWAMLDNDGRQHLAVRAHHMAVRAHQGDAAARAQLARLEQLLSGDEGAVVRAECERLHQARDANARAPRPWRAALEPRGRSDRGAATPPRRGAPGSRAPLQM